MIAEYNAKTLMMVNMKVVIKIVNKNLHLSHLILQFIIIDI